MELSTCSFLISHPHTTKFAPIQSIQSPENGFKRLCIELINKAHTPESPHFSEVTWIKEEENLFNKIPALIQSKDCPHSLDADESAIDKNHLVKPELKLQSKLIRFSNKKKTEKSTIIKRFTPAEKRYIAQVLQYMIIDMKDLPPSIDKVMYLKNKTNVSYIPTVVLHRQLARNLSRWKQEAADTRRIDIEQAKKMHNANKQPDWNNFIILIDRRRDR